MSIWNDIHNAVYHARQQLEAVKTEAEQIGRLARDPMVLRNMSKYQLTDIKKQLRNFNSNTGVWKQ